MDLEKDIKRDFPKIIEDPVISDQFIEENEDIMMVPQDIDLMKYVPSYMLWSVRNKDKKLVDQYTVNALAEYGRAKPDAREYLTFKYTCNENQIRTVINFLYFCRNEILVSDKEQIDRALKHWKK